MESFTGFSAVRPDVRLCIAFSVRRCGAILVTALVFVVSPRPYRHDMLSTTAQLPNAKKREAMKEVDAASIIATLNDKA